jgi:class 3 adenylate cyclase/pimeloyl-ACP methyl ester carboxylesterase
MTRSGIQFVASHDGTRIAYWSLGSGPPLVVLHNFTLSSAELEWEIGSVRSFYEALAEHHQVIRLDPRGSGLSAIEPDPEVAVVARDVLAVIDAMKAGRFDLVAASTMAPVGISLATTERVNRLVLCDPTVTMAEAQEHGSFIRATEVLSQAHLDEPLANMWVSVAPASDAEALRKITTENFRRHPTLAAGVEWDGRPHLRDVTAPTLVIYTRGGQLTSLDQAREAAGTIPDARLVAVDGRFSPYFADRAAVMAAFAGFLGWQSGPKTTESGMSVVVFTDVVASTEIIDRLGDAGAWAAQQSIERMIDEIAKDQGGRVVKHLGDGSLLEFESASRALEFARRVQSRLADDEAKVRIGMAAGEPIREDGDLHGAVVVVASRINALAGPGEVLVSGGVRHLVVGKGFTFDDLGDHTLKGFNEPVRLWRLQETG